MTLRPAALALVALLSACASDPGDGPADASSDTSADVAAVDVSDARGGDVTDAAQDTPAVDAPADVASDAGGDAADVSSPDVVSVDGGHDAGADAGDALPSDAPSDASTDVSDAADAGTDAPTDAVACQERSVRCSGAATEFCVGGVWVVGSCGSLGPVGTANTCAMGNCYACRRSDSGAGCASEPLCATDDDCFTIGRGQCVGGLCARRGFVRCATIGAQCDAWLTTSSSATCATTTVDGRSETVCGGAGGALCTDDAMCPRNLRCEAASGFCVAR